MMNVAFLLVAVIAATTVEMVEALTIVLASGITRGWRSTLEGAALALVALAALVALFGQALTSFVPLDTLQLFIGVLLLIFGLQWLRKAILRASGYKALHDEASIYQKAVRTLSYDEKPHAGGRDAVAFTISFKGVFLEGVEVIFIVLTFGTSSDRLMVASVGAIGTALVMGGLGLALARPLTRVPENWMKMGVGLLLTAFGTFWMGEGLSIDWPGGDLFILSLIGLYGVFTIATVAGLRRGRAVRAPVAQS